MRIRRGLVLSVLILLNILNASGRGATPGGSSAGSISGTVTSSATGQGLANTRVRVFDLNNDFFIATVTTDSSGNYAVNLPDGSYAVLTDNTQGLVNEIWNNVPCSAVCDVNTIVPIDITGSAITGIDFALGPGGRVSGTVTSTATGLPVAGIRVQLVAPGEGVDFTGGVTDANGNFTTDGGTVAGSVYAVTRNTVGYQDEAWDDVKCGDCDPPAVGGLFVVAGSGTTPGLNFSLDPGGTISGTVVDDANQPLAGVLVHATNAGFTLSFQTTTDAAGNYTTGGMPTGTYFVATYNGRGYADYAFNGVLCPDGGYCNRTVQGTPVSVTVGSDTPDIDFVLPVGGKISGAVTNAVGGAPVPVNTGNAGVSIYNALGVFVMSMYTDGGGLYTTPALPPGTYYAQVVNVPTFGNNLYNGLGCFNCPVLTGTPITVTAGGVTPNINFALSAASGSISGTVTNAVGGTALANYQVQVFSSTGGVVGSVNTNASGLYTFPNLPAGSYYVRTNQNGSFANEIYNDIPCQQCAVVSSGAPLVAVTTGNTTGNIDFALAAGGRISGAVTNANGGAGIQVQIQLFNANSVGMGQYNTAANGTYTLPAVPAGTYYVRTNNTAGFINELWDDIACPVVVCVASDGAPISVTAGVTTTNINFALSTGGRISGTVATAGGAPLQNINVQVVTSTGRAMGAATSDATGNYTTQALPDGTYYLRSQNSLGLIDEVFDDEPCLALCVPTSGTPVVIAGGVNVTGRNFALAPGGAIGGTIRNTGTLQPVSGVGVSVYSPAGLLVRAGMSIANGTYLVTGIPAGTYYLRSNNTLGYRDAIYEDLLFCETSCLPTDGTPVVVTAGHVTAGIDFDLTAGVETIQNPSFTNMSGNAPVGWSIFAAPNNPGDFVGKNVAGAFEYYRVPGSAAGVILQNTGAAFASGDGILAQFSLANTSDVRKRISVLVHDSDFSDLSVCTFFLPPNSGLRRYAMLTHTTEAWANATISLYAATAGSDGGAYRLDDVTMQTVPWPVEDTTCVDPLRPAISSGQDGPELLTNGDFSTGTIAGWNPVFQIVYQVVAGVFEFYRPAAPNHNPAGVLLQHNGVSVAAGEIVTAQFQLGNSSGVRKRVTVLLHDFTFGDLSACTFWLAPGQPLSNYTMRSYATQAWSDATISVYGATDGNDQWIRLDNVSLKKTPSGVLNGTTCDEPGVAPAAPPETGGSITVTNSRAGASGTGAMASGTTTDGGPIDADLTILPDGVDRASWGLGPIDLRHAPVSSIRFQSQRRSGSRAAVEVSTDGVSWRAVGFVPLSDDWVSVEIDLSAFAGEVIYLRFAMESERAAGVTPGSRWQIRRLAVR